MNNHVNPLLASIINNHAKQQQYIIVCPYCDAGKRQVLMPSGELAWQDCDYCRGTSQLVMFA